MILNVVLDYECIIVFRYVYVYTFICNGYYICTHCYCIFIYLFLCLGGGMGSMRIIGISFLRISFLSVWGGSLLGWFLYDPLCWGVGWVYTLIGSLRIGDVRDPIVLLWVLYYEFII